MSVHPSIARLLDADFTALSYPFHIQVADKPVTRYGPGLASVQVIEIGWKLADAFFFAHSHGVALGRIEPSDLLLTADGEPVLILPHLPIAMGVLADADSRQDVHGLCQTLLSMLTDSPEADRADSLLADRARDIMHEQPQLRLTATTLRDQLNALKKGVMQFPDDLNISARFTVRRKPGSSTDIVLTVGDLFNERADLVIGFSDTFDTAPDGVVISPVSVQGQLVRCLYGDNPAELDSDLDRALALIPTALVEDRSAKPRGKLKRYPVGTVATWEHGGRRIYAVAVSHMGNDLIAQSSPAFLDRSLNRLWHAIRRENPTRPIAMPIIGSGLSRMNMSRNSLLQEIVSSFTAETQKEPICRELRVVVHPSDMTSVDFTTVDVFTRGLSSA